MACAFDAITQITMSVAVAHAEATLLPPLFIAKECVCLHTLQPLCSVPNNYFRIVEIKIEHDTLALPCQSPLYRVHAYFSSAPSELHFSCTAVYQFVSLIIVIRYPTYSNHNFDEFYVY